MTELPASKAGFTKAGFTLVEVLVALVLVALGAAAVMSALSTGARAIVRVEERTLAEWVALNVLAEARLADEVPAMGERAGEVTLANQRWQWSMRVSATAVPDVLQLDVTAGLAAAAEGSGPGSAVVQVVGARLAVPRDPRPLDTAWQRPGRESTP